MSLDPQLLAVPVSGAVSLAVALYAGRAKRGEVRESNEPTFADKLMTALTNVERMASELAAERSKVASVEARLAAREAQLAARTVERDEAHALVEQMRADLRQAHERIDDLTQQLTLAARAINKLAQDSGLLWHPPAPRRPPALEG